MRSYEFLPHTADIKVLARGDTLDEAVMAAADALLASITDIAKVQDDEVIDITVRQPDLETLLVSALEELLFYHETEGMVFKRWRKVPRAGYSMALPTASSSPGILSRPRSRP